MQQLLFIKELLAPEFKGLEAYLTGKKTLKRGIFTPKHTKTRASLLMCLLALILFTNTSATAQPLAKADCSNLSSAAKDLCLDQVKGREKLASAQLAYKQSATPANAYAVTTAKADTAYADYKASLAKCDTSALDARAKCVQQAREKFKKGG